MKNNNTLHISIFVLVILISWEIIASTSQTFRLLISSPTLSCSYFFNNFQNLSEATVITGIEAILGLIFGTFLSITIMIGCMYFPKYLDFLLPLLSLSQVVPIIVLAPFFVILFGMGLISKIAMATLISFFPVFLNFATGFKQIDPSIVMLTNLYKPDMKFKILHVFFPLSMPSFFAGLKISANLSVIGAIVAEFTGANIGLGKNLYLSALRLDPELMVCSLFLSSFIGVFMYYVIVRIENRFVKWLR